MSASPNRKLNPKRYGNTGIKPVDAALNIVAQDFATTAYDLDQIYPASGLDSASTAPTNQPTGTTKTIITNEDSSMDVVLTWSYTQGVIPAEFFVLFWKEGTAPLSALTTADNAVAVSATARAFRFEGLNPLNNYRFGIAAGRRPTATSGAVVGNIVQPNAGGGSWADLTFGTPNYVGTVWNLEQHNFTVEAAGVSATDQTVKVTKDSVDLWNPTISAKSYNVLVYDLATKAVVSTTTYDVQTSGANATTMANALNALTGNKLVVVFTANNPQANRTSGGLPDAIAAIGGSRTLFSTSAFRAGSAYICVGKPLSPEGSGLEVYAGKTDNATDAHASVTFQTQGSNIVALSGTGWNPAHVPGTPTNNPSSLTLSNTTIATGNRTHKLTWSYSQPALSGSNAPADGFILYYQATNTSNPGEQQVKLDAGTTSFTFEWSLASGAVVSYAIAAYRKTTSGVEVGTKQTTGAWQNVAADQVVQTAGLGDSQVTTVKVNDDAITSDKRTTLSSSAFSHVHAAATHSHTVIGGGTSSDGINQNTAVTTVTHSKGRQVLAVIDTGNSVIAGHYRTVGTNAFDVCTVNVANVGTTVSGTVYYW